MSVSIVSKSASVGRLLKAMAMAPGDPLGAAAYASGQNWRSTPDVERILKAVVDPGSTTGEGWANDLHLYATVAVDFAEMLRPATVIGRMTGFRRAPFNTRMLSASVGAVAHWRGEANPVPATSMNFDENTTLVHLGVDAFAAITRELARSSSPTAETVIAADMSRAMALAMDQAFLNPENAGVAGAKPAAVTYGATTVQSTGSAVANVDADLRGALDAVGDADLTTAVWCMRPKTAAFLSTLRGSGGAPAYPGMSAKGGQLLGLPVLTSRAVEEDANSPGEYFIALVVASEVLLADDGGATFDASEAAAVQMVDGPDADTGAESLVSLWQNNLVGLKATRYVNWRRRNSSACSVIVGVTY